MFTTHKYCVLHLIQNNNFSGLIFLNLLLNHHNDLKSIPKNSMLFKDRTPITKEITYRASTNRVNLISIRNILKKSILPARKKENLLSSTVSETVYQEVYFRGCTQIHGGRRVLNWACIIIQSMQFKPRGPVGNRVIWLETLILGPEFLQIGGFLFRSVFARTCVMYRIVIMCK